LQPCGQRDFALCWTASRHPLGSTDGVNFLEQPTHRAITDDRLHSEQLGNGRIFTQSLDMRIAPAIRERRRHERREHIVQRVFARQKP